METWRQKGEPGSFAILICVWSFNIKARFNIGRTKDPREKDIVCEAGRPGEHGLSRLLSWALLQ